MKRSQRHSSVLVVLGLAVHACSAATPALTTATATTGPRTNGSLPTDASTSIPAVSTQSAVTADDDPEAVALFTQAKSLQARAAADPDHGVPLEQQALALLEEIIKSHPAFAELSLVLAAAGTSATHTNNAERARELYTMLLARHPEPALAAHAHMGLAEYHFEAGHMTESLEQYTALILMGDTAPSDIVGYAMYKRAWVRYNLQDSDLALQGMLETLHYGRLHADSAQFANIVRQAKLEAVHFFAATESVDGNVTMEKIHTLLAELATNDEETMKALAAIADEFDSASVPHNAVLVYNELLRLSPRSPDAAGWKTHRDRNVRLANSRGTSSRRGP